MATETGDCSSRPSAAEARRAESGSAFVGIGMRGLRFKFHGKGLLVFIRAKGWMSLFPHSGWIVRILGEDLADLDVEGRTILFQPD